MTESDILDSNFSPASERRRKLLPIWIKIFVWIYMVFSPLSILVFLFGFFVNSFQQSFLGLQTSDPFSLISIMIFSLYLFKGIVAFSLWMEKDWAINLALVDAYLSIVVCMSTMLVLPLFFEDYGWDYTFRIELVAIIPYLLKMKTIKWDWEKRK